MTALNSVQKKSKWPAYSSRICRECDRVYLFPQYGGRKVCNDCKMED